jgi:hypothetical protein
MKTAFWHMVPCSLIEVDPHFRSVYRLHHQGLVSQFGRVRSSQNSKFCKEWRLLCIAVRITPLQSFIIIAIWYSVTSILCSKIWFDRVVDTIGCLQCKLRIVYHTSVSFLGFLCVCLHALVSRSYHHYSVNTPNITDCYCDSGTFSFQ